MSASQTTTNQPPIPIPQMSPAGSFPQARARLKENKDAVRTLLEDNDVCTELAGAKTPGAFYRTGEDLVLELSERFKLNLEEWVFMKVEDGGVRHPFLDMWLSYPPFSRKVIEDFLARHFDFMDEEDAPAPLLFGFREPSRVDLYHCKDGPRFDTAVKLPNPPPEIHCVFAFIFLDAILDGIAAAIDWEALAQAVLDFPHLSTCESWVLFWGTNKNGSE